MGGNSLLRHPLRPPTKWERIHLPGPDSGMWPDEQKLSALLGMLTAILSRGKHVLYFCQYYNIYPNIQGNCRTLRTNFLPSFLPSFHPSFLPLPRHVSV